MSGNISVATRGPLAQAFMTLGHWAGSSQADEPVHFVGIYIAVQQTAAC